MAGAVFALDTMAKQVFAVGVGYVLVILLAARAERRSWVLYAAIGCTLLAATSYIINHGIGRPSEPLVRTLVGLSAIVAAAIMASRSLAAAEVLRGYTTALDQAHDGVSVTNLQGEIIYWNQGASDLYGWSAAEALGKSASELLDSDIALPPVDLATLSTSGSWQGDVVIRARDGRRRIVHSRCLLLRDDKGKATGILTTGNDITERHDADQEVRKSEARSRQIFQATGVSIWECDFSAVRERTSALYRAGVRDMRRYMQENPGFVREAIDATRIVDVNDATVGLFGAKTKEEILGRENGRFWPVSSEPAFADSIMAAIENVPRFVTEVTLNTLDGRRMDFLFATAFPPETASRESIFVAVSDITALNEAQSALNAMRGDLAHASRLTSLGELTASIAHEVNQPLAGILSNAQASLRWLRRPEPDMAAAEASIESIVSETRRAGSVLNGIRALAKKQAAEPRTFDMDDLVRETVALLRNEVKRRDADLATDIEPGGAVRGDPIQIQQVLINLVMNGLQAMEVTPPGDRRLNVSCSIADVNVLVTVSDSGPGIDPSVRDQLFAAFVTTKEDGMGLGLSVCASIVRRHGGTIWAENADDRGAHMRFSLPLCGDSVS